jgi:hypothetical protein
MMRFIFDDQDLARLKPETRADIFSTFFAGGAPAMAAPAATTAAAPPANAPQLEWENVVDLTLSEVELFMAGAGTKTRDGLEIFAKLGPVIPADALNAAGITNYGHFQGRVTQRTRTIKKRKRAFLFGWDDWTVDANAARGFGHYGVTDQTWRALRQYFKLP